MKITLKDLLNLKETNEKFSKEMVYDTNRYQKKYGFDSGTNSSTHNNEADAFMHTLMQAYLSILSIPQIAKYFGDDHEKRGTKRDNRQKKQTWIYGTISKAGKLQRN